MHATLPTDSSCPADDHAAAALRVAAAHPGVRAVVLVRDGVRLIEHYRDDIDPAALQAVNSVTKTVVGLLAGVALQRGDLDSLDTPLAELIPEANAHPSAHGLSLWHLLALRAGFAWDETQVDDCLLHACSRFEAGDDRLRDILGRPRAHAPGVRFNYDSHATHLLGLALARASGRPLQDYARDALFAPLGIDCFTWESDENGAPFGGRGLALRPRDLAALGALAAADGVQAGRRLLPAGYLDRVMHSQGEGGHPVEHADYAAGWWTPRGDCSARQAFAFGFGEQLLWVDRPGRLALAVLADNDKRPKGVLDAWRGEPR